MKWTSETPKEAGFYWYVCNDYGPEVVYFDIGSNSEPTTQHPGTAFEWPISVRSDQMWSGPIPEPEE